MTLKVCSDGNILFLSALVQKIQICFGILCEFPNTVPLYIAVGFVETAITGKILVTDTWNVEHFSLIPTYVCDYLLVLTLVDPCILTIAVQDARRICLFVQDQLYLATKTRG
jgi:hypothetical protein